ncbi:hypothetical protein OAM96_00090 [Candidatus Poseidoniaceae archaeon]|nr:hypothetical protein [Candidatus Poseidoniaceae archaeon]|tara:strand:- start:3706 stop:4251 length:546 start_codon:yes stop_codon:yes gene_type:complete
MQQRVLAMLVVLTMLLTSTVGCLGLIPAREAIESFREPAEDDLTYLKIDVSHTYTSLEIQPYTNKSVFIVDDSVTEISIYFKASFFISDFQIENNTRYVRATLTDSEGEIQWSVDVSSDSAPVEEKLEPDPVFTKGDWVLDVEARGIGEETLGLIHDNFNIQLTVTQRCVQYPMEKDCSAE